MARGLISSPPIWVTKNPGKWTGLIGQRVFNRKTKKTTPSNRLRQKKTKNTKHKTKKQKQGRQKTPKNRTKKKKKKSKRKREGKATQNGALKMRQASKSSRGASQR